MLALLVFARMALHASTMEPDISVSVPMAFQVAIVNKMWLNVFQVLVLCRRHALTLLMTSIVVAHSI
jgi:hypothetical protein